MDMDTIYIELTTKTWSGGDQKQSQTRVNIELTGDQKHNYR